MSEDTTNPPVLQVDNLHLEFGTVRDPAPVLRGVNLTIEEGRIHGLVGESGGGKTMVGKSVLGILPRGARVTEGAVRFAGQDLFYLSESQRRNLLGRDISMILQDPMTALNPVVRIGPQVTDVLRRHLGMDRKSAEGRAVELLDAVHLRDAESLMKRYPHELSGGMRQRVIIAVAFACEPKLVIADEPTTALDVTVQRQILKLIREMQARTGAAVLFITHDLGVVAKICDEVSVIYAGQILEHGETQKIFNAPEHAYTRALMGATPRYDRPGDTLHSVPETLTTELWDRAFAYDRERANA